jgi:hypothetical protein
MPNEITAPVHGVYGSGTEPDRQQRMVNSNIVQVYPEGTPFFTLLENTTEVSDGRANKMEFQYKGEFPRIVELTAALEADATALTVASNTHITESQILQDVDTGEQLLVLGKTNSTGITVGTRGQFGGGAPRALAAGAKLVLLGTAREEGAPRLEPTGIKSQMDYNWFQQFEHVFGGTDRAEAILMYGPSQGDQDSLDAVNEYKKKMERQFLFGFRDMAAIGTSGATTHARFICGGMRDFIETYGNNVFDAGGAFTYQEFCKFMVETIREGNSGVKFGLSSRYVLQIMSMWALQYNQMQVVQSKKFGLDITQFIGPGWQCNVLRDDQFETEGITDQLMIVDRKFVKHHIMRSLGDKVNRNVTGPEKDGDHTRRHQLTGVHSLEVNIPGAHALIKNITS